jgi:hypothetical protein
MVGLAPPPPVLVAQSATTTPVGIAPPPQSKPALQVVVEPSGIALEPAPAPTPAFVDRDSEPDLDSVVPRKRKGVVVAVMGVAIALIAAMGIRMLFVKGDTQRAMHSPQPPAAATKAEVATTTPKAEPAAPPAAPPIEAVGSAAPVASDEAIPSAPSAAPAASGENSALAAASMEAPVAPAAPVALASKKELERPPPTKGIPETPKAHTPQRVEEPKKPPRVHAAAPPRKPRVSSEGTTHSTVSPTLPGGGAIVRQSPF